MQQHDIQGSSAAESSSTSNIKRYKVSQEWADFEVFVEVDHNVLTPERANDINRFWSGDDDRVQEENGDVVRAVIRMFGAWAAGMILRGFGANFGTKNEDAAHMLSVQFRGEEGWGGENGTPFGWCGIRIVAATVECPGFDEFEVREVANG